MVQFKVAMQTTEREIPRYYTIRVARRDRKITEPEEAQEIIRAFAQYLDDIEDDKAAAEQRKFYEDAQKLADERAATKAAKARKNTDQP